MVDKAVEPMGSLGELTYIENQILVYCRSGEMQRGDKQRILGGIAQGEI